MYAVEKNGLYMVDFDDYSVQWGHFALARFLDDEELAEQVAGRWGGQVMHV